LRFDNSEPDKKKQHISELEIKQNESDQKENSIKNKSQNMSIKPKNDSNNNTNNTNINTNNNKSETVSLNENKTHYNKIDLNSLKKPMEKKATKNLDLLNKSEKKASEHDTNSNIEKSVKSDLIKNSDKNSKLSIINTKQKSKVIDAEANNDKKSLNSLHSQSKHNMEEFLRKTDNFTLNKKLIASINCNNKVNMSWITNNSSVNPEDNKSKISNLYLKSNKEQLINSEAGNITNSFDKINNKDSKGNGEIDNKSIKSVASEISVPHSNNNKENASSINK